MRSTYLLFAAALSLPASAGVIVLEGNYQGKNLFNQNPFSDESIHQGPYRVGKKHIGESHESDSHNENLYRVGHPLAQRLIQKCKEEALPVKELSFNYSGSEKKISILEDLLGKAGWLAVRELSITSFEAEDHIQFAGIDDSGNQISEDHCQRLFSLTAAPGVPGAAISKSDQEKINEIFLDGRNRILEENGLRNNSFFDAEVEKLEKWSEDVRNSIKAEIKDLDKEIKARKTEARKLINLEQKVKEQRIIKELEKKLAEKRYNQYQSEDEIEQRKDQLLDEVESRLRQFVDQKEVFIIRWNVQ